MEATIMISIIEKTEGKTDDRKICKEDWYRIDLFFLKKGDMLIIPEKSTFSLPYDISTWSASPEDVACKCARRFGIVIHQFDYPLGFSSFVYKGISITSYALVPSMWKEESIPEDAQWVSPLRLPKNTTPHTKEVMCKYFRRVEEELIYGSFTE